MTLTNEEFQFIIAQVLLSDPTSERPHVHKNRRKLPKTTLIKRLESLAKGYEETDVDPRPYYEAAKTIKTLRPLSKYTELLEEINEAYGTLRPPKAKLKTTSVPRINPVVILPKGD